ncbi:MAG: hypothetical protein R3C29_11240 [Dehalococcoidia bacterium]
MQDRSNFWTRNWKRRRFLSGSALAASGAATLALVGCGDDDDDDDTDGDGNGGGSSPTATAVSTPTATPEADVVKRGGHLNLMQGAIRSLDPAFRYLANLLELRHQRLQRPGQVLPGLHRDPDGHGHQPARTAG